MEKHLIANCSKCKETMVSLCGGHWVSCGCEKSFIDRDRWFPNEKYRLGGHAENGHYVDIPKSKNS